MYAVAGTLVLLVALLILGRREHLEFTSTIKDVRAGADATESKRIFGMAPTSLQTKAKALGTSAEQVVAGIVADFQSKVYVSATSPVTEDIITAYVREKKTDLAGAPESPTTSVLLDAYSNGDAKQLLLSYFTVTPAAAPLPGALPSPESGNISIPEVIDRLRDNLLEYRMTGKSIYKTAYEGTKRWLDQYIASMNTQIAREGDGITTQVTSYETTDQDLLTTQAEFQRVKTEGPELENKYLTIKKQADQASEVDNTSLYVKGAIIAALVVGAVVLVLS
jgi:hypothetical protein